MRGGNVTIVIWMCLLMVLNTLSTIVLLVSSGHGRQMAMALRGWLASLWAGG